ncbi:MAG: TRAP transporter small permease [Thiolinea sp.]
MSQPTGIISLFNKLDDGFARLEGLIMALGVILMAVNTITNVISRFVFDHSIAYSEELNSIFILLVTFAGIGYAARRGRHIRMSAIYEAMPHAARKQLMLVMTGFTGLCMLFLAWYALEYVINLAGKGRIMPALGIPVYLTYLWVPVGFFITGIQYLLTCWKNMREADIYLSTTLPEHKEHDVTEG